MAKYKLLTQEGYHPSNFTVGEIYDEEYLLHLVKDYPEDWQLVDDEKEIMKKCLQKIANLNLEEIYPGFNKETGFDKVITDILNKS